MAPRRAVLSATTLLSAVLATAKDYQPMNPRPCEFRVRTTERSADLLQQGGRDVNRPALAARTRRMWTGTRLTFRRCATRRWATQTGRWNISAKPANLPRRSLVHARSRTLLSCKTPHRPLRQVNDGTQAQTTVFVNICNNVLNPPQVSLAMARPAHDPRPRDSSCIGPTGL
jgi:hypothetical protein